MNTFKRKALFSAVAAGLGVVAGSAEAVYLNPNGTGQALVYPYYTTQTVSGAAYNTLPSEASYRKAVTLQGTGKYVEFTTPVATNSIVFRYSIPDTGNGSMYTTPLCFDSRGTRIHLIDTPGYPDFLGQSISALQAVDTVVVVINAQSGIELTESFVPVRGAEHGA